MVYYILVGQTPVPCKDVLEWAEMFEKQDRCVFQEHIGNYFISTVFLGIDHNFFGEGPPILFETMVFIDREDVEQMRCATWSEAERQHKDVCWAIRQGLYRRKNDDGEVEGRHATDPKDDVSGGSKAGGRISQPLPATGAGGDCPTNKRED